MRIATLLLLGALAATAATAAAPAGATTDDWAGTTPATGTHGRCIGVRSETGNSSELRAKTMPGIHPFAAPALRRVTPRGWTITGDPVPGREVVWTAGASWVSAIDEVARGGRFCVDIDHETRTLTVIYPPLRYRLRGSTAEALASTTESVAPKVAAAGRGTRPLQAKSVATDAIAPTSTSPQQQAPLPPLQPITLSVLDNEARGLASVVKIYRRAGDATPQSAADTHTQSGATPPPREAPTSYDGPFARAWSGKH